MRLIAAFMVAVLSVSAFGQSCERTVPVSSAIPGYSIQGLTVTDFQATLLNDAVDEYLVTVAVPDIALDQKARWQLRRSNEVKTPPGQSVAMVIFAYPDLLLCNPAKDGSLRYASARHLPFFSMEVK